MGIVEKTATELTVFIYTSLIKNIQKINRAFIGKIYARGRKPTVGEGFTYCYVYVKFGKYHVSFIHTY
jgi:hypothetical protein